VDCRSNNPSLERPGNPVAPEQKIRQQIAFAFGSAGAVEGVSEKAMTTTAILWFLMATTGPRMDEGGPIAHPGGLAYFHTKAECGKKAL
jgi:hypothetical protein